MLPSRSDVATKTAEASQNTPQELVTAAIKAATAKAREPTRSSVSFSQTFFILLEC